IGVHDDDASNLTYDLVIMARHNQHILGTLKVVLEPVRNDRPVEHVGCNGIKKPRVVRADG
ncbi:MAG: hypothetical protein AAFO75_12410, partial [Pseudomonadota bacterium]